MTANLSPELSAALKASGHNELEVIDPQTQQTYVLCDAAVHEEAKRVLDREAIGEGIAAMERGDTQPVDEAFDDIRNELGFSAAA